MKKASRARLLRRRLPHRLGISGHHRDLQRQQEQVRAGQGNRAAPARSWH